MPFQIPSLASTTTRSTKVSSKSNTHKQKNPTQRFTTNAHTAVTHKEQSLIQSPPAPAEGFAPAELFQTEYILWRDELKVLYDVPLGHGHFSMAFAGELQQEGEGVKRVAVKTHSEHATQEMILEFLKEAAVMQYVSLSLSVYYCREPYCHFVILLSCIIRFIVYVQHVTRCT